ncbi:hypothetical protein NDU88_007742 [Pleurodeles waltl]|uniref:Uncharacterized protein n=1 Tax=Pleurodeles waltl TaxID=8319 RepID=A0AAV7PPT6_PLEWA|nr:hypothetical protein NDU88_007742 [Pleurodeles waltl]
MRGAWPGLPARWPSRSETLPGLGPFIVYLSRWATEQALGWRREPSEPLVPFCFWRRASGGVCPQGFPRLAEWPVEARALPLLGCALLFGLSGRRCCCREVGVVGGGHFSPCCRGLRRSGRTTAWTGPPRCGAAWRRMCGPALPPGAGWPGGLRPVAWCAGHLQFGSGPGPSDCPQTRWRCGGPSASCLLGAECWGLAWGGLHRLIAAWCARLS